MDISAKKYFVKIGDTLKSGVITASSGNRPVDCESIICYLRKSKDKRIDILRPVEGLPDNELPQCSIHLGVVDSKISVSVIDSKTSETMEYTINIEDT